MADKAPEQDPRSLLSWFLVFLGAAGAAALGLLLWIGRFDTIHSSTGAWIMAQVSRAIDAGDYAAAASISMVPNTTYNVLYPLLVVLAADNPLGRAVGSPVFVAHCIAAAALGLAAVPLARLWRASSGPVPGVMAGFAVMLPPMVATAALVRYESLAIALVLLSCWASLAASQRAGWWRWAVAGLLAGLAYNTREYLLAPALSGLGVAWVWAMFHPPVPGRSRMRQASTSAWLIVDGLIPGLVTVPLLLGMWPQNGVRYLFSYGAAGGEPGRFAWTQLFELPEMAVPYGLGIAGLIVATVQGRGSGRAAAFVRLGLLLPFAAFPLSSQQSPQYYLLAKVVILSGTAGLVTLVPRASIQGVVAGVLVAGGLAWAAPKAAVITAGVDLSGQPFHSEAWPAPPGEPDDIVDWAHRLAGDKPLVVVTDLLENLDALFLIRHNRPVASLHDRNWAGQLRQLSLLYRGQDLWVLTLHRPPGPSLGKVIGEQIDVLRSADLVAQLHRAPGRVPPKGWVHPGYPCLDFRGACLQRDWLEAGEDRVRARILSPGLDYAGGPGPGRIW